MIINVSTTPRKYFRECLEILKMIDPLNKLNTQELDVLGELLYFNYELRGIKDNKLRYKLVFDYDTKVKIGDQLSMKGQSLDNIFTRLRAKNIIKGKTLVSDYKINIDSPEIVFKFKIDDSDKE